MYVVSVFAFVFLIKLATNFKDFPALTAIFKDFQGLEFLFSDSRTFKDFQGACEPCLQYRSM